MHCYIFPFWKRKETLKKLGGFRAINNILGKVDPRIARKWHKRVQNAILWRKMQKRKIMLDFRLFAVKSMKFSLTRFPTNVSLMTNLILILMSLGMTQEIAEDESMI